MRRGKGKLEQEKTKIKLRSRVLDGFVGEREDPSPCSSAPLHPAEEVGWLRPQPYPLALESSLACWRLLAPKGSPR